MRLLIAALMLLVPCLGVAAEREIVHDGETRRYWIEPPIGPRPAPAIVVLHGGVTVPSRMRRVTHFTMHEKGWAEIYPAARGAHWDAAADLGFVRALIDRLAQEGLIDRERIFLAGASDGGAMVLRLVCEWPGLAAGAAVVSMTLPRDRNCTDGPPLPLLFVHGTADPVVPFDGGPALSATETVARFALRNGCGPHDEIAITDHYPGDGARVRLRVYRGCTEPLRHYIVEGGGHTWPGNRVSRWVEERLGNTARDISATFEIESFFADRLGR